MTSKNQLFPFHTKRFLIFGLQQVSLVPVAPSIWGRAPDPAAPLVSLESLRRVSCNLNTWRLGTVYRLNREVSKFLSDLTNLVAGHAGRLVAGLLGPEKTPVICMAGRLHTYEGYDIKDTVFPIRVFVALKIQCLIVTNAAGGLNPDYKVGDLMLLTDHVNLPGLAGLHPLKGPNDDRFGPRFPALSDAYDHDLRAAFFKSADNLGIKRTIHEGTYAFVSGPTYETRAEVRFLLAVGADAVGMSTVPEIIVARHSGLRVLALSLITNAAVSEKIPSAREPLNASLSEGKATHQEVVDAGNEAAKDVQAIVGRLVSAL
ncbi:purine-nucleoside phosphorylase [Sugiyamaella lignohabitans]|uniref:purine-nucleoside phosphorylase n=1 Tax=Sugiyamaella lignohabitans TaxID=796027 RepID=A0A167DBA2_9ASCO|nr:purine-nucleoside phosphorylase [Sugiyamaella lignohabitans]ANB12710.1 purine-nucleoside phosphorylase [Sugiyamaella lignohabitans]